MTAPLTSAAGFPLPTHHGPPRWSQADGTWLVTRYADLQVMLRSSNDVSPDAYTKIARVAKGTRTDLSSLVTLASGSLVFRSPPYHTQGRAFLQRVLTVLRADLSEAAMRSMIQTAILRLADRGPVDAVAHLCDLLPVEIILKALGLSPEAAEAVAGHTAEMLRTCQFGLFGIMARDMVAIEAKARRVLELIHQDIQRAERTGEGQLARVLDLNRAEFGLAEADLTALIFFLAAAGIETTTALLASALFMLCATPGLYDRLGADRSLVPSFMEEVMRVATPLHTASVRKVPAGTVIGGVEFNGTETLAPLLEMGNHDPDVYDEPGRFRLDRRGPPHLAFGLGGRSCIGAGLARLETRVFVNTLLDTVRPRLSDTAPQWLPPPSWRQLARLDISLPSL
jgi:cytochrome P450